MLQDKKKEKQPQNLKHTSENSRGSSASTEKPEPEPNTV